MCVLVTQLCLTLCDPMNCLACQVLHPWEFSKEEYWSRLLFPPPGDLPNPGIELTYPALAGRFLTNEPPGKPRKNGEEG